jgi:hypothetical protein
MPFVHGKNTSVYLGAIDLSRYLDSMELAAESDFAETTTFKATWRTGLTGVLGARIDYTGLYDPTELQLGQTITNETPGVLTYCPGGDAAIGDRARLAAAFETTWAVTSPVGGVVAIKGQFTADGVVGIGDVLHPVGEDTNTTTGAEKDDAAASSTGWTAHLHVIAVDGGSWVVKLQDAASSGSYTDLSGGAFTAATAGTSQRLRGASGATLRRYVRYVATRTGGAGGDGITFALAYARN